MRPLNAVDRPRDRCRDQRGANFPLSLLSLFPFFFFSFFLFFSPFLFLFSFLSPPSSLLLLPPLPRSGTPSSATLGPCSRPARLTLPSPARRATPACPHARGARRTKTRRPHHATAAHAPSLLLRPHARAHHPSRPHARPAPLLPPAAHAARATAACARARRARNATPRAPRHAASPASLSRRAARRPPQSSSSCSRAHPLTAPTCARCC